MPGWMFVDRGGTSWMVLAGLPTDFPDGADLDEPFTGLTFCAATGEVRVLPRAAIPRRASNEIFVAPLGSGSRVRAPKPLDWEAWLRHAVVWPTA